MITKEPPKELSMIVCLMLPSVTLQWNHTCTLLWSNVPKKKQGNLIC
uniref:Uncharacterized protein n=1 Tax=Rhizophora mucronata TaxID=61149 RepID=A0A2P2NF60_RHIMU